MGFVISGLYFITYYLTPTTVFGPLGAYRVELILAVLVLLVSLPKLVGSFIGKTTQSLALIGLAFAVLCSVIVGEHWAGGGLTAFLLFIPNAFAYFLVCLHCDSMKRLRGLVLMMLFVCLFVIGNGIMELQHGAPVVKGAQVVDQEGSYLLLMTNDAGEQFYQPGPGEINDPNDFAQVIACLIGGHICGVRIRHFGIS